MNVSTIGFMGDCAPPAGVSAKNGFGALERTHGREDSSGTPLAEARHQSKAGSAIPIMRQQRSAGTVCPVRQDRRIDVLSLNPRRIRDPLINPRRAPSSRRSVAADGVQYRFAGRFHASQSKLDKTDMHLLDRRTALGAKTCLCPSSIISRCSNRLAMLTATSCLGVRAQPRTNSVHQAAGM